MQLRQFMDNGGAGQVNVLAINWTESDYGISPARLKRFIGLMHANVRVVSGTEKTGRDFGAFGHVPVSFVFDSQGKLVFGNGDTTPLDVDGLKQILEGIS